MAAPIGGSPNAVSSLIEEWRSDEQIAPNFAAWRTLPARGAKLVPLPNDLSPRVAKLLNDGGLPGLYTHQASAWYHTQSGHNIVVVTSTASGKTLCYALPIVDQLERDPDSRSLILYPTKALAHDQVATLTELFDADGKNPTRSSKGLAIAAYDGDTPTSKRRQIRANARIVVSNPDMAHTAILPHHTEWGEFFEHLKFIVLDEAHVYRGVFGSHVANVLRRLKRIANFYGSKPQFILTSGTIGNPIEFAEKLIEQPVALVDDDGSSKGERHFAIYNPPVVNRELGIRKSAVLEGTRLAQSLMAHNVQAIIFARTRRTVELLLKYLSPHPMAMEGQVRGYRSGYLPNERREIEEGLRNGDVQIVAATTALELGIDIGAMGCAVMVGYPGSIAATMQQAGRAGRKTGAALAVLVASAEPLDQYLARHPNYLFGGSPEHALIDPDNELIVLQHIRCAVAELAFYAGETFGRLPGSQVEAYLQALQEGGIVHQSGDRYHFVADQYPAEGVSLRSASPETVVLSVDGKTIGEVDLASAYWMVHPEAIYLHESQSYLVESLDLESKIARLNPTQVDYITEPRSESTVQLLGRLDEAKTNGGTKYQGEIAVTTQVIGFRKRRWTTHENLGDGTVSLPTTELHTTAYWVSLDEETVSRLRDQGLWSNDPNDYGPNWPQQRDLARARDHYQCVNCGTPENGRAHPVHHKVPFREFPSYLPANVLENLATLCPACHRIAEAAVRLRSGLAGVANVVAHIAPLFLMCDGRDIGIHSDPQSPLSNGNPTVAVYDQIPAGIGFSERLFQVHEDLVNRARDLVKECECLDGCPSCVGAGGEHGYGGKREALALLTALAIG
jgi:DEAD/DEAH box helicase domain-containing protein